MLSFDGEPGDLATRLRVLERALSTSTDAVCIAAERGGDASALATVYTNAAFEALTGYGAEEAAERHPLHGLFGAETNPAALAQLERAVAAGASGQLEALHYRKDGTPFLAELRYAAVRDADSPVTHWVFTRSDVTERWQAQTEMLRLQLLEARLANAAYRDDLTGLPNRALFLARLRDAVEASRDPGAPRKAVLFLDIDRFKLVNDNFGHLAGDRLLAALARRLERYVRRTDTLARIGGDEFMVLLDGVEDEEHAAMLGQRVVYGLHEPFPLDEAQGRSFCVSASVGIAMIDGGYEDPEDVLRDADVAMYRAKDMGVGRCAVFAPELRALRSFALSAPAV
jgi:diguanylate cyclase (GGDEF)-like protein/PAS domain S-box-containing protein